MNTSSKSEAPSPQQMRAMGYSADAEPIYLSEGAWLAFCAWVNMHPEQMPPQTRYKPRETAAAWERVAAALLK